MVRWRSPPYGGIQSPQIWEGDAERGSTRSTATSMESTAGAFAQTTDRRLRPRGSPSRAGRTLSCAAENFKSHAAAWTYEVYADASGEYRWRAKAWQRADRRVVWWVLRVQSRCRGGGMERPNERGRRPGTPMRLERHGSARTHATVTACGGSMSRLDSDLRHPSEVPCRAPLLGSVSLFMVGSPNRGGACRLGGCGSLRGGRMRRVEVCDAGGVRAGICDSAQDDGG